MSEATLILVLIAVALIAWLAWRVGTLQRRVDELPLSLAQGLEQHHRGMLVNLHDGLTKQGDRLAAALTDNSERLRSSTADELKQTRDTLHSLQLALSETLGQSREAMLEKLAEITRALTGKIDERLEQISVKVSERLDEGFKKTNETFTNVMTRLATIDEAQKKIETLTGSVVSLQDLLGDKRSRGAFGEMQLEQIVRNLLPETAFEFQYTFARGVRADCVLKLPEPMGLIAVDSKFPLENYERMFLDGAERATPAAFKADVRKHIDDIATKYIIPGETGDGAVMFVPAESVFAEIHGRHRDLVEYAQGRRVWIASPTTLMAILTTAQSVIRSVETRRQIHIIQEELRKLGADFGRFQSRMDNLARHIEQAKNDVDEVHVSSRKISERFAKIERVELEVSEPPQRRAVEFGKQE
ncbi:MAG: DNA recombination protein RmuC [Betaproteobacteria bacterium]|nr:MAG: DNA recombination protein RmuC [Betaproteobacteria bacterium]